MMAGYANGSIILIILLFAGAALHWLLVMVHNVQPKGLSRLAVLLKSEAVMAIGS